MTADGQIAHVERGAVLHISNRARFRRCECRQAAVFRLGRCGGRRLIVVVVFLWSFFLFLLPVIRDLVVGRDLDFSIGICNSVESVI